MNEEPDVGKPLVRFCEGLRRNWCMAEILWHRRETRRQTENTNRLLRSVKTATEKRREQNRAEGRGVGR